MTHVDNLPSIMNNGILCRNLVEKREKKPKQIANPSVLKRRKEKGLDKFANLYMHPRNAMLYQVSKLGWGEKVIILGIDGEILNTKGAKISIGNAAADSSIVVEVSEIRDLKGFLREFLSDLRSIRYWGDEKPRDVSKYSKYFGNWIYPSSHYISAKQFLQSEVLIPDKIPASYIRTIYVSDEKLEEMKKNYPKVSFVISPDLFFRPLREVQITKNIKLIQGDMFISDCKLLTISVNTVGVMGKGLASRLKYMYPEAYVVYQDMCRNGKLKPGQPQIYWSETYKRYFLFFPTKRHWKENSKLEMIKQGLEWCVKNLPKYQPDIESAAFPALGCGLGKLKWEDVGSIMVSKLSMLESMQFEFYLPADKKLPEEYFQLSFYKKAGLLDLPRINLELF